MKFSTAVSSLLLVSYSEAFVSSPRTASISGISYNGAFTKPSYLQAGFGKNENSNKKHKNKSKLLKALEEDNMKDSMPVDEVLEKDVPVESLLDQVAGQDVDAKQDISEEVVSEEEESVEAEAAPESNVVAVDESVEPEVEEAVPEEPVVAETETVPQPNIEVVGEPLDQEGDDQSLKVPSVVTDEEKAYAEGQKLLLDYFELERLRAFAEEVKRTTREEAIMAKQLGDEIVSLKAELKAAKEEAETAKYWQQEAEKELVRYQEQEKLIKQAEQDAEEQKRLRMEAEQRNAARIAALEEERQREAARIEEEVRLRLAAEEEAARQKQIEEEKLRYEAKLRIEEKLRLKAEAEEEERMRAEVEAAQAMAAEKERQRMEADGAPVAPVEEPVAVEQPPAVVETEEVESTVVENGGEPAVTDMPMAESTDIVEEVEVATPPPVPATEYNPQEIQVPEPTAAVFEVHDADSIVLEEVDDTPVDTTVPEDAWVSFNEPEIREKKSKRTPDVNEEGWETATPEKVVTSATKQSNWESFNEPELVKQVQEEVNIAPASKKEEDDGWGNFYIVKDII